MRRSIGKHMVATEVATRLWHVHANRGNVLLGTIGWNARWRCFEFAPRFGSFFTADCLQPLAAFLAELDAAAKLPGGTP
jgi:hypothetical protein